MMSGSPASPLVAADVVDEEAHRVFDAFGLLDARAHAGQIQPPLRVHEQSMTEAAEFTASTSAPRS